MTTLETIFEFLTKDAEVVREIDPQPENNDSADREGRENISFNTECIGDTHCETEQEALAALDAFAKQVRAEHVYDKICFVEPPQIAQRYSALTRRVDYAPYIIIHIRKQHQPRVLT